LLWRAVQLSPLEANDAGQGGSSEGQIQQQPSPRAPPLGGSGGRSGGRRRGGGGEAIGFHRL
jgi:hypothetical protein